MTDEKKQEATEAEPALSDEALENVSGGRQHHHGPSHHTHSTHRYAPSPEPEPTPAPRPPPTLIREDATVGQQRHTGHRR